MQPTPERVGATLLQTPEEWDLRNRILSARMAELINRFASSESTRGLEVGCQGGALTDAMLSQTRIAHWSGIDPALTEPRRTPAGAEVGPGRASRLERASSSVDVVLFANVYEHIPPPERDVSLREMFRILVPGGVVVGQLPNPYFPIESHSRLPFMGWLPIGVQRKYWRFAPVSWEHDFYTVTIRHLIKTAVRAGFTVSHVNGFSYPPEVIPARVRWAARMLERPMRLMPWSWQFVLARPQQ